MRLPRVLDKRLHAPEPVMGPEKVVPSDDQTKRYIEKTVRDERRAIYARNVPELLKLGRTVPYDPARRYSGQCVSEGIVLTPPINPLANARPWPAGIDQLLVLCADSHHDMIQCTACDGESFTLTQDPRGTSINNRLPKWYRVGKR